MTKVSKRLLAIFFVLVLCFSSLAMQCFATVISKNFTIPTGSNAINSATMYPSSNVGSWAVGSRGTSNTKIATATLKYITSTGLELNAGALYDIGIGRQKTLYNIVFNSSCTYYVKVVAQTTAGVVGVTTITQ